jgi:hypothetical protein
MQPRGASSAYLTRVLVTERNRRVAKAYARAPVLTVNGSDDGFDGFRIGKDASPFLYRYSKSCLLFSGYLADLVHTFSKASTSILMSVITDIDIC